VVVTIANGAICILGSAFALRESTSPLERARARLVLCGAVLLPLLPTALFARGAASLGDIATSFLWASAIVAPLPIGLAISRYNLFDLEWDVRRWIGKLVYFGTIACGVTLVLVVALSAVEAPMPMRHPPFLFALAFGCAAAVEPLRGRLLGFLESMFSPGLEMLRQERERFARDVARLRTGDAVTELLSVAIENSLAPRWGLVLLATQAGWGTSHAFGDPPPQGSARAEDALRTLGEEPVIYLTLAPDESPPEPQKRLQSSGVELVASLTVGSQSLGMLILGPPTKASFYTGFQLDFLATVASHAAGALQNAKLTEELVASERQAATGRLALGLAHDVGKDVDWMWRLVNRLPRRLDDSVRLTRDVEQLRSFVAGVRTSIRDFVKDATAGGQSASGAARFDSVVERTLRRLERIHGAGRVTDIIDPSVRTVPVVDHLGQALVNVLDNAILANAKDDPVHLYATREGTWVRITVTDRGSETSEGVIGRAFELGFSTRAESGGSGIGLSLAREMVEALGGTVRLDRIPTGGAQATIKMPILAPGSSS
jgi:signal transduction histidine kinase